MTRVLPYFIVAAICLLVASAIPAPVIRSRSAGDAAREAGIRLLGAARGYATAALWLRAGEAYSRGDLHETRAMYQIIRELQPRNPAVYSFQSWNEGYNLSAQFPDPARRFEWIERGLNTLHVGQKLLPHEAGLLLDEWHYLLNRSKGFPVELLRVELPHLRGRDRWWADRVEALLGIEPNLGDAERAQMREFLDEYGLQVDVFDMEEFRALAPNVLALLTLANWARWHAMVLVMLPALEIEVRGANCDSALLNSYILARKSAPPQWLQHLEPGYRQGVKRAYAAGLKNARRIGGEKGAELFIETQRVNFADLPGWID